MGLVVAGGKYRCDTFQLANNKGADQTVRMSRLVCAFVVHKAPKTGFLATKSILYLTLLVTVKVQAFVHFLVTIETLRSEFTITLAYSTLATI